MLFRKCKKLWLVDVSGCVHAVDDDKLRTLTSNCKALEVLRMGGCTHVRCG